MRTLFIFYSGSFFECPLCAPAVWHFAPGNILCSTLDPGIYKSWQAYTKWSSAASLYIYIPDMILGGHSGKLAHQQYTSQSAQTASVFERLGLYPSDSTNGNWARAPSHTSNVIKFMVLLLYNGHTRLMLWSCTYSQQPSS